MKINLKKIKLPESWYFYIVLFFVLSWAVMHYRYLGYTQNWKWFVWSYVMSIYLIFILWFLYSYLVTKFFKLDIELILKKDLISLSPLLLLFSNSIYSLTISLTMIVVLKILFLPIKDILFLHISKVTFPNKLIYLFMGIYFTFFSYLSIMKHKLFYSTAFDLGIFSQTMWGLSNGEIIFNTIRGLNLLGDHLSLIAFVIAPIYRLFPRPETLLVIQTFALAIGALPIYWLARDRIKNNFTALIVSLTYLLYPALHFMNMFDFHYVALQVPLVLFAFYFLQKKEYSKFYIFCFFLILCYETASLTIFMFSIYLFFVNKERVKAVILGFISLGWFFLAIKTVIPLFRGYEYGYSSLYSHIGTGVYDIIKNMITKPFNIIKEYLFTSLNFNYIMKLFVPILFISFIGFDILILAAPNFLMNLLSSRYEMHDIYWQYNSIIISFIFISLVYGIKRIQKIPINKNKLMFVISIMLMISVIFSNNLFGLNTTNNWELVKPSDNDLAYSKEAYKIISLIPQNASVSASNNLVPHLSNRELIFMYPLPFRDVKEVVKTDRDWWGPNDYKPLKPDYIILNNNSKFKFLTGINGEINQLFLEQHYNSIQYKEGLILFSRKSSEPVTISKQNNE